MLRALILISILLLVYIWARKNQCNNSVILFFIILAGWFSKYYPTGERPQLFSFFFAPLTVFLLESFKKNSIMQKSNLWIFILLPIVAVVWANCHRGFPLGTVMLIIYWGAETVRVLFKKSQSDKKYLFNLTLIISITIAVLFINPNTYGAYLEMLKFQGSIGQQRTSEYISPFVISKVGGIVWLWPYWTYLFITLSVFIWSIKRVDYAYGMIVLFLALISLSAIRYIPFFIYTTIPFTVEQVTFLIKNRSQLEKITKRIVLPILIVAMIFISAFGYKDKLGKTLKHPIEKYRFPENAVSFIKQHSLQGNLFNHFEWGGYLIWELYPDYKVFIDGRNLNFTVFRDYTHMKWDLPEAQILFDRYGINIIISPGIDSFTGELYTIVNYLVRDDQWHLIYWDEISLIFVRGIENDTLIKRLSIPKAEAYNQIIMQGTHLINSGMKNTYIQQTMKMAYRAKRMYRTRE